MSWCCTWACGGEPVKVDLLRGASVVRGFALLEGV
jgi:hypothetical protein